MVGMDGASQAESRERERLCGCLWPLALCVSRRVARPGLGRSFPREVLTRRLLGCWSVGWSTVGLLDCWRLGPDLVTARVHSRVPEQDRKQRQHQ